MLLRWVSLASLALVGCGPSVGSGSAEGGGTGSSAGSGSAEDGGTGPSGGAGSADGGGTGGTTGDVCDALESVSDPGPAVTISIVNQRATPVSIQMNGCVGTLPLTFTDAAGEIRPWQLSDDCFPTECAGFITQGHCSQACADCGGVPPLRLDPGNVHHVTWSGGLFSEHELPPVCLGGATCATTCLRLDQVAQGRFDLVLTYSGTCTGDCNCEVSPMGAACPTIDPYPQLGDKSSAAVALDYPAQTSLTLALQ